MDNSRSDGFDLVVQEFIEFVNAQTGMYIDALAGFRGNHREIKRQVHKTTRPVEKKFENGLPTIVWASYEDPSKPDVIHSRIVRAADYLDSNRPGGSNEQQHARSIIVFTFTFWELEIRPRLASCKKKDPSNIKSDVMGDLRIIRNAILHANSVITASDYKRLKATGHLFFAEQEILLDNETMNNIFRLIHQDCARLIFEWLDVKDSPIKPEDFVSMTIQSQIRKKQGAP